MQNSDLTRPAIDPRALVRKHGMEGLAQLLAARAGYVCQRRPLIALSKALRRNKPLLIEGDRGAGKTALAEALAAACNLPVYYLQCMSGIKLEEVLYKWDTTAQNQFVEQQVRNNPAPDALQKAQAQQWTREFLKLGEALQGFELAAALGFAKSRADVYYPPGEGVPIIIEDEIDKLDESGEDTMLQILARGYASVPRLSPDSRIGVTSPDVQWPIVVLTSNNMRSGVSAPLRSRTYYTSIRLPTQEERINILSARVPAATPELLAQVVKMVDYIAHMGGVTDPPAIRETIDFLETLVDEGVDSLTREIIEENVCALVKNDSDEENLMGAVGRAYKEAHKDSEEAGRIYDLCLAACGRSGELVARPLAFLPPPPAAPAEVRV